MLPRGGGPDGKAPIVIAKGTVVDYHLYSMHRREDFFGSDATEFKPERWEDLKPGWNFLPFNAGPRGCLGRKSLNISPFDMALMHAPRNSCIYAG